MPNQVLLSVGSFVLAVLVNYYIYPDSFVLLSAESWTLPLLTLPVLFKIGELLLLLLLITDKLTW